MENGDGDDGEDDVDKYYGDDAYRHFSILRVCV